MSARFPDFWSATLTPSAAVDGSVTAVLRDNRQACDNSSSSTPTQGYPLGWELRRAVPCWLWLNATSPEWPPELANNAPGLEGEGGEGSCKGRGLRLLGVAMAVQFIPETVEALLGWALGSGEPLKGGPMGGGSIIPSRPGALGPMSMRRCTKSLPTFILKGW